MSDFRSITTKEAIDFLLPRHYSGRKPQVTAAFGSFIDNKLKAVLTFGKPASKDLCNGVCGKEYSSYVYELNRLCRDEDYKYPLSEFVSWCLRQVKFNQWIIVSYSDTGMHHNGYIYQACNFLYTGSTKPRTDPYYDNGKHARHLDCNGGGEYRQVRTAKNRYIYFACDKKHRKQYVNSLNYPILDYPKNQNQNYVLGEYMQPIIVKKGEKICQITTNIE